MKLSFRAIKGINRKKQGLVYYAMLNRRHAKDEVIDACEQALTDVCQSEYDHRMLKEFVETDISTELLASKYYCSARKIQLLFVKYMRKAVEIIINRG